MIVDDVRADGDVDRDRDAAHVGLQQQAELAELRLPAAEVAPQGFTDAEAIRDAIADGKIDVSAGLLSHAESALLELGFDIFAGRADEGDFEVMDDASPIHRDGRDEAPVHEVDQHGTQAGLDDVTAQSPQDRLADTPCPNNRLRKVTQGLRTQEIRQAPQKVGDRSSLDMGTAETAHIHLAGTILQRVGANAAQIKRLHGILGHAGSQTSQVLLVGGEKGSP